MDSGGRVGLVALYIVGMFYISIRFFVFRGVVYNFSLRCRGKLD